MILNPPSPGALVSTFAFSRSHRRMLSSDAVMRWLPEGRAATELTGPEESGMRRVWRMGLEGDECLMSKISTTEERRPT